MANEAAQNLSLLEQSMRRLEQTGAPRQGGIISGPIFRHNRNKRQAKAQEEFSEVKRAVEQQRGDALLDTFNQDNFPDTDLESFRGILTDPATRAQGISRLESIRKAGQQQNVNQLAFHQAVNSQTSTLRGQYHQAIRPVVETLQSVQLARGQLELGSPEAAFNGVRIFIQQLDKSMVTNPELQAVAQQSGIAGQIDNLVSWLEGGGATDTESRKRMVDSMSAIGQVMEQYGNSIVTDMTGIVENNALPLDVGNVITMGGFANREFDLSPTNAQPFNQRRNEPPPTAPVQRNDGTIEAETNVGTRILRPVDATE